MGKPTGFLEIGRKKPPKRDPKERIHDSCEVETSFSAEDLTAQASRCMDCGVAFCHKGCPLGNLIPDWNDAVYRGDMAGALARLHETNNFPEFTGHTCPAPCEDACVLSINDAPVTIKQIEREIIDRGWDAGLIMPVRAAAETGRSVAVVGSGPAGLALAQQLRRAGHGVTVFERADKPGGLLRYGIPDFKLEKLQVERRVEQMRAEGVVFRTGVSVGKDATLDELERSFDAVCIATGALAAREMPIPGRELQGVHLAMTYLEAGNRAVAGEALPAHLSAKDKHVVILGGGDTGADCLGTAHRQGAKHTRHYHYKPAPPSERGEGDAPWPWVPMVLRDSSSHEEGGERDFSVVTKAFEGENGVLQRLRLVRVEWVKDGGRTRMREVEGSEFVVPADLALIAIGFEGTEHQALGAGPSLGVSARHTLVADEQFRTTRPGVFACGDARRGASLVVWAIWEGRECARAVDLYLMGKTSLPTSPNSNPIS